MNRIDLRNLIASMVSASALLVHGNLDAEEARSVRSSLEADFSDADRLGVPYSVQNAALYAGRRLNLNSDSAQDAARRIMQEYAERLTPDHMADWKAYRLAHV